MYLTIDYDDKKDRGVISTDADSLSVIREHFSEEDKQAGLKKRMMKRKYFPTRKYVITETGRFKLGLLPEIITFLKTLRAPFKMVFTDAFKARYKCNYEFPDQDLVELLVKCRDYQIDAIKKAIKVGCGITLMNTGAGKTLTTAVLIATIKKHKPNTRVLMVTLTSLVDQTYNEFISFGIDPRRVSKWSGDYELDPTSDIVICGIEILYPRIANVEGELNAAKKTFRVVEKELKKTDLGEKERAKYQGVYDELAVRIPKLTMRVNENIVYHSFFKQINLLIVDEAHKFKHSNQMTELFNYIQTRNVFLFTATMPESAIDRWNMIGLSGPILSETVRTELVNSGYITDVNIKILEIKYKTLPDYSGKQDIESSNDETSTIAPMFLNTKYEAELEFIHKNKYRNNLICNITNKLNKNTLILVNRLEHGVELFNVLSQIKDKKIYFIRGEMEKDDRNYIQQLMEKDNNIICIAMSAIFSVGINIKNLHYIMFAMAGKAKIRLIQSIGRGVRAIQGKTEVVIIDIADMLLYGSKHIIERIQIYDQEGFKYKKISFEEQKGTLL